MAKEIMAKEAMAKEAAKAKEAMAKEAAKAKEPKPNTIKWSLGKELELKMSSGEMWTFFKGDETQEERKIYRRQSLVNSKGLTIGQVERTGSVRLTKDSVSGKQYLMGNLNCAYKLLSRSGGYIVDANEFMEQEVEAILDGQQVREVEMTTLSPQLVFVGSPRFSFTRIITFTRNGVSLQHQVVKAGGPYKIIFNRNPIWKQLYPKYPNPSWWSREILKKLIYQHSIQ